MTASDYIGTPDIPEGLTIREWRASRPLRRRCFAVRLYRKLARR